MILATNVTKKFGKLLALDAINLSLNKGESIALIGPNGSGKTTFIKCLLGMVVPDSGFITVDKQNIQHDWKYRSRIGYMAQIGRFPDNMTIAQVIGMMKDIRKPFTRQIDDELVELFELNKIMEKRMQTLSGGTRQKVGACLAFMFQPDILILDEPTAGLDPVSTEILKAKIIKEKANGKLILVSSHVLSDLDEIITEVIYMQDGKLKFHKSFQQLKADTGELQLSKAIAHVMRNT
ncbi:MAG: transporter related protein [Segetibacter sp.]|jgi:Cu-processing system ATP-binding protein|nr:transporter related protein [Segetibacter sp.]